MMVPKLFKFAFRYLAKLWRRGFLALGVWLYFCCILIDRCVLLDQQGTLIDE